MTDADRADLVDAPDPSGLPPFAALLSMMPFEMPQDPATTTSGLRQTHPELVDVEVEDLTICTGVPARVYRGVRSAGGPIFVWVHGGAFIGGDLDFPEANWVGLALAARDITVVSIDYRKALGGISYPAPIDDVLHAWEWTAANKSRLGGGPMHLGGASAGAALVLSGALRLRDQQEELPSTLTLAYPSLHRELPPWPKHEIETVQQVAGDTYFSSSWVREMNANYLGDGGDDKGRYAFPGENDPAGLPPQLILLAENDSLRSSGEAYASAAEKSGGQLTITREPGSLHGFLNAPDAAGNAEGITAMGTFIHQHR